MNFVPITAELVLSVGALEAIHGGHQITPEIAVELEAVGGFAAVDGSDVLGIGGILPRWPGVGMAWTWLGRKWRRRARVITDFCRVQMDVSGYNRIEAGVRVDYQRGHSWAQALGFEVETPVARAWGPDGGDYTLYVRLK
jgi:hypothetical protein